MTNQVACKNCIFYDDNIEFINKPDTAICGYCMCGPPIPDDIDGVGVFPIVYDDSMCGQFMTKDGNGFRETMNGKYISNFM